MRSLIGSLLVLLFAVPAFAAGPGATNLTWVDNATNEAGTHIHRAVKPCAPIPVDADFTKIGEVGANIKVYTDATTQAGNRYCYKVRAWNLQHATDPQSAQYSVYSNLAGVDYPLAGPAAPTGLTAD
jgi:hypothetical protein